MDIGELVDEIATVAARAGVPVELVERSNITGADLIVDGGTNA